MFNTHIFLKNSSLTGNRWGIFCQMTIRLCTFANGIASLLAKSKTRPLTTPLFCAWTAGPIPRQNKNNTIQYLISKISYYL